MRPVHGPALRLRALLGAALVCAACGSNPGAGHTASPSPLASATGPVAGADALQTQPAAPRPSGSHTAGAPASPSSAAVGAHARPATAANPQAAAPGDYPLSGSYTSTSTTQATPSSTSGSGTLSVAGAQATSAGSEQDSTYHFGGQSLGTHDIFAADGSVLVSRSGNSSFSPSLPIVPAGLHDGMAWGPVHFTSGSSSGTMTGSAGKTAQRSVGGVSVTIVPIKLHIELQGSFNGTRYTATADESLDWAPSLHLPVHMLLVTDAQYAAAGRYHSELDVALLSAHPR
jgi:hypothetical protein